MSWTSYEYIVKTYKKQSNDISFFLFLGIKETVLDDLPLIVGGTIGACVFLIIGTVFAVFFIRYEENLITLKYLY